MEDEIEKEEREDDDDEDYERHGVKKVTIVVLLGDKCEDFEVDNIHEGLQQSDGVFKIESFQVEGFPERRRWGQ